MGGPGVTQTLVNRNRARGRIRDTVRRQGARLKGASAPAIIASMVVAAFMPPGFWQTLSTDGSIRALALAAIGGTVAQAGQSVIATFLLDAIERLRRQKRLPGTEAELQQELERQLLAALQANDQPAAQLRADAAAILEQVQGVEAALEAATGDLRQALSEAFAEYGSSFAEFRWMLDETRQTLTAIQQEQPVRAPCSATRPSSPGRPWPRPT